MVCYGRKEGARAFSFVDEVVLSWIQAHELVVLRFSSLNQSPFVLARVRGKDRACGAMYINMSV